MEYSDEATIRVVASNLKRTAELLKDLGVRYQILQLDIAELNNLASSGKLPQHRFQEIISQINAAIEGFHDVAANVQDTNLRFIDMLEKHRKNRRG